MSSRLDAVITGVGAWHPTNVLDNAALCDAFNRFVRADNARHQDAIDRGERAPLRESSPEFIEKASGIRQRYVHELGGLLDPERMCPNVPARRDDELSLQAEYALAAARPALAEAGRRGDEVDLVILGALNLQRPFPAIAIEVQHALGAQGHGYDISVGCSSATNALHLAAQALTLGDARCALVVVPEMTSGYVNWRDRDSHFIFGDASAAIVVEPAARARAGGLAIRSTKLMTSWSSNIRNNGGFLDRCDPTTAGAPDRLFYQQGRRVFREVAPLTAQFLAAHVAEAGLAPSDIARWWLHQANSHINDLVMERVLGRPATPAEAPSVLGEYGNAASAGSIIALERHRDGLARGDHGVIASFGAGYSIVSLLVEQL